MYIFGISMQNREPRVPKEVAEWIKERMEKYPPDVDFELNYAGLEAYTPEQRQQYQELVKKYSRFYKMRGIGVMAVTFPYLNESWSVKIIMGADKEGQFLDPNDSYWGDKYDVKRTDELRREIAGLPAEDQMESVMESNMGEKRREGNPALEMPREYVEFLPEMEKTSEVQMTGEQFAELANDPKTSEEFGRAIMEKDWETLKKLKSRKIH